MEQHHIATIFKIFKNSNCDIFENLNEIEYKNLRKLIINNILATDMKEHFNIFGKFESKYNEAKENDLSLSK